MEEEKPLLRKENWEQESENWKTNILISTAIAAEEDEDPGRRRIDGQVRGARLITILRRWISVVKEEAGQILLIAAPMVAVSYLQLRMIQLITIVMLGRFGELSLSSSALSFSITNVTGFSVIPGMACGLETLCGQAYGAKQYRKVGTHTYTGIFALTLVSIPISVLWFYMGNVLILLGQDAKIALEAGKFAACLVPGLIAYAVLQPLCRYFLSQSMTTPMLVVASAAMCVHVPLCWVLVFKTQMANLGAAIAVDVTIWLNVIFLVLYMRFSSACEKTRAPISTEVFKGIGVFLWFAVPSAAMICFEWWSFEIQILLSGLMSNPQLQTSVLSICMMTSSTLYNIPNGLGAGGSTRVANELGAGNPQGARTVFHTLVLMAATEGIIASSSLFALRNIYGYIFSNNAPIVAYVARMAPVLSVSVLVDSLNGALTGVLRGAGMQHAGAIAIFVAYYIFGNPTGAMLGFWLKLAGVGLWLGVLCGSFIQLIILMIVALRTDWEKLATEARQRIFDKNRIAHDEETEDQMPEYSRLTN